MECHLQLRDYEKYHNMEIKFNNFIKISVVIYLQPGSEKMKKIKTMPGKLERTKTVQGISGVKL